MRSFGPSEGTDSSTRELLSAGRCGSACPPICAQRALGGGHFPSLRPPRASVHEGMATLVIREFCEGNAGPNLAGHYRLYVKVVFIVAHLAAVAGFPNADPILHIVATIFHHPY